MHPPLTQLGSLTKFRLGLKSSNCLVGRALVKTSANCFFEEQAEPAIVSWQLFLEQSEHLSQYVLL